jgi:hypothetical protein
VHYHPVGFPNDITDTDSHSLNLFQPSITFSKSVDVSKSKAGDDANYTLTLNNTSSSDTPALNCTIRCAAGHHKSVTSSTSDVTAMAHVRRQRS